MRTYKIIYKKDGKTIKSEFLKADNDNQMELLILGTKNSLKIDKTITYKF